MSSTTESTSDTPVSPRSSAYIKRQSYYEYDPSISGIETSRTSMSSTDTRKSKTGKPRWFSQVKDWLSVSEPSALAMKEQKKNTFKKHGIDMKDPRAAVKLHLPIGKIPEDAITSTRGPSPEKAHERARQQRETAQSYSGGSQASHSVSSGLSTAPSAKEFNPVTPWDSWSLSVITGIMCIVGWTRVRGWLALFMICFICYGKRAQPGVGEGSKDTLPTIPIYYLTFGWPSLFLITLITSWIQYSLHSFWVMLPWSDVRNASDYR